MKSQLKSNDDATVKISAEIPAEEFEAFRGTALKHLSKHIKIDGFREGAVPDDILTIHIGDHQVLTQMAEMALDHHYPALLKEHNIAAIGQPQITITKLAAGNPLEVTIKTAILPEIKLEDYNEVAKKIFSHKFKPEVTEEKVGQSILNIRKQLWYGENRTEGAEQPAEPDEKDLPVLDEKNLEKLGVKSIEELQTELKKRLLVEEELKEHDRRVTELLDTLVHNSNLTLPELIIEAELSRMMAEMKVDIERVGLKFDNYLTHIKKTEEELREEHRESATKRATSHMLLKHIARKENLTVNEQELNDEVTRLKQQYPQTNTERIKSYVEDYMENQEVIKYLEAQGKVVNETK
ncbi:MAG: trigger factor [bacterium]|nr:trigger factor [bacterium]